MRSMRRTVCVLAFAAFLRAACAEDVVSVRMAHSRYLQFEPVVLFVTVKNTSDDLIIFSEREGSGDASLYFAIDRGPTEWVRRKNAASMTGKIRILPGSQREIMIELSRWFDVTEIGSFVLRAVATIGGERFESAAVRVEVANGLPIEKVTRRSPLADGRMRTYGLRYLSRDRSERLFLRIDEEETGDNCGSFELGPLMRVRKPEIAVDGAGVITVTHQSGADRMTRSVFKTRPEGIEFVGQTYLDLNGKQPLAAEKDGKPFAKENKAERKEKSLN